MRRALLASGAVLSLVASSAACTSGKDHGSPPVGHQHTSPTFAVDPASTLRASPHAAAKAPATAAPFRLAHLVVVMEENRSYDDIVHAKAPYLHALIAGGTSMTNFFAIRHPSEPNYLALFAGSTQGLTNDACPLSYGAASLASELRAVRRAFVGYAEGLPSAGYRGCAHGRYVRRHAPWTNFRDLPSAISQPLTRFPRDYSKLPSLSFVIPNLDHDMHDGTITRADTWLHGHLGRYASWARTHNSALMVTWDEDDHSQHNQIPAIVYGARVRHGTYTGRADLYTLLRTVQWLYGLEPLAHSADRSPITRIWTA